MVAHEKNVIIVGLGFAGFRAWKDLHTSFNVTCVDSKTFFEYVPTGVDSIIDPSQAAKRWLVDYSVNPKLKACYKQGVVTAIASDGTAGTVTLSSGVELPFDYCVVAAGSAYKVFKAVTAHPLTKAERVAHFQALHDQIAAAEAVVCIGGGTVGVELASGIAEKFPTKPVALISSAPRLLERMEPKAGEYAAEWLGKHGIVKVIYGERVQDWGGVGADPAVGTVVTDKGTSLTGLVIRCVGVTPATAAFGASLGEAGLTPGGAIVVLPTLQLPAMPNVLAAGDIAGTAEEKTANFADYAGQAAASNIKALAAGAALQTFPHGFFGGHDTMPMLSGASLGAKDGVMTMGSDVTTGGSVAFMHNFFASMGTRAVAGWWFWGALYGMIKGMFRGQITGLAKKESAAA